MADRPYVLLSCCISLDGYLDDGSPERLVLSNAADLDRVDALRAECDAILVGAATVRNDDPRLLVRSAERRAGRAGRGLSASPVKVTLTGRGKLDPGSRFFVDGDVERLVYCTRSVVAETHAGIGRLARVIDAGETVSMTWLCEDLHARGIRRLLVEGGASVLTQFLAEGVADELQLAIAPLFVGDDGGVRFVESRELPWHAGRRAQLVESRTVGDVAVLRYALSDRFTEETT